MSDQAPSGIRNGDYYAFCDICGYRYFGMTMLVNWRNQFVCTECYEDRHPQDILIAVKEVRKVPVARPDTTLPATTINVYDPTTQNMYGEDLE